MLRVPMADAQPGMVLALAVHHPKNHGTLLLRAGVELETASIQRLRELGMPDVWIRAPGLECVARHISPQVIAARARAVRCVADAFDEAAGRTDPKLEWRRYRSAMMSLVQRLGENEAAAFFVGELADSGGPAVRHGGNVAYLSVLMGLRLEFYLERERPRMPPALARDVAALGVAGMLHDIGMTRLPEEVLVRWRAERDEEDPEWRRHVTLGFEMVRGRVEPSAASAVLHHHQRFDGLGFPPRTELSGKARALSGREIHVFARIIAAADLFDRLMHPASDPGSDEADTPSRPAVWALRQILTTPLRERIDPVVLGALVEACPAYAPGSIVTLSNGQRAAVIEWSPADPCRPTVALLDDTGRQALEAEPVRLRERRELSIAAIDGHDVRAVNFGPEAIGVQRLDEVERAMGNRAAELLGEAAAA